MEKTEKPNQNIPLELARLRKAVHNQQEKELAERKRTNPQKSHEEAMLGVYVEELEPQVRGAVLELNRKGYPTYSSGFGGEQSELQVIEGDYALDETTQNELQKMDVEIVIAPSWKYKIEKNKGVFRKDLPEDAKFTTTVQFLPASSDLGSITDQWDTIARKFPDRGHYAIQPYPKTKP